MSYSKRLSSILIFSATALLLLFGGCKNPFEAGLGDKVDINRPEISITSHVPGEFLQEVETFSGAASDDSRVTAVRISFDSGANWNDVSAYDAGAKTWQHLLDTTSYPNGTFKVLLRVIDDSGKRTDTEELVFTIDNLPPQIEIQVPAIDPATYNPLLPPQVAMNGVIVGIVTDLQGVAVGYPRIKFWKDGTSEPDWDDGIGVVEVKQTTDFRYRLIDDYDGQVGTFWLRLQAVDVGGDETIVPPLSDDPYKVEVISGDTLPIIAFAFTSGNVNTISGGNYAGQDYRFQVTASHPNSIDSATLQRTKEGGSTENLPWGSDDLGTPLRTLDSEIITVASDGSDDGTYEFRIEAVSSTGSLTELYRTVIVDATPPNVEITNLSPTVVVDPNEYINGMVQINALASDVNAVQGSKWWMLPSVDPSPASYDDAGGTAFLTSTPSLSLDSTTLTDGTAYTFYIISRDRAGNDTVLSRNLTVSQATDLPTVTMTDIDTSISTAAAAGVGGVNLLESNARLSGVLEDDDRINPASVILSLNGTPVGAIDSVGSPGRSVTFSHNVNALGQGVHYFSLEFSDDATAKNGKPAATKTIGPVYFVIDTAPPALAVTSPGAGTYQRASFTLSGTADDVNGLSTVTPGGSDEYIEVAFPDAPATWVSVPVNPATNLWTVTAGGGASTLFGGAYEGPQTISLRGRDRFNKLSTGSFAFTVDTVAPSAAITVPAADEWLAGVSGSVQGTASDATSSISQVRYWIGTEGVDPPADVDTWTLASGTSSWNSSINLSALGEGRKTLHVRARDAAGVWSPAVTRTFGIDQAAPTVTETDVGSAAASINEAFSLGGLIADSNALDNLVVTQARGTDPAVQIYSGPAAGIAQTWSVDDLPRDPSVPANLLLADGIYTYSITVTDSAAKSVSLGRVITVDLTGPSVTITNPAPAAKVQGTALSASGTAADFGGVSAIAETRYYVTTPPAAAPADFAAWNAATGGAVWSATLNFLPAEEGPRVLHAAAKDAAGNWSPAATTVNFMIDQAAPEIQSFSFEAGTINTVGGNSYARADFSFSFTAYDSNALSNVLVTRNGTEVFDGDYSSSSQPVTVNQTVGGPGLADGYYEYVITVTDVVGNTAVLTRSVVVDTEGPLTEIASLTPLLTITGIDYVNGTIRFTASASDGNGLTGVKWWMLPSASPAPADYDAAGGTAFGAAPYTATVNTAALTDATEYVVYVIARDRALNDTAATRTVTVSQATDTPAAAITLPGAGAYVGGGYTVRGAVTDDDGVNPGTVQVRYYDGTAWSGWAAASVTGTGREVAFTYVLPAGIGADGAKQVQARAYDDAAAKLGGDPAVLGESAAVSFTLDSLAPAASVSVPAANSASRVTFTVSGGVVEMNLESLRLNLDGGAFSDAAVAGAGETKTWSYDLAAVVFDALAEGPHTITVEAVDLVGRAHTVQRVFYKDTAGPAISFSSIVEGADTIVTDPTPVLRGGFSDDYSNNAAVFEYRIDSTLEADPWTALAVTGSGKSVTWAVPVDGLADGSHAIDVRIFDSVGNSSVKEDVAFRLDRAVPVIAVSSPAPGGLYGTIAAGTVFTLAGTAGDATLTAVYARLGSGSDTDITGTITGGSTSWTFPVAKADFDLLSDGPNTVTLTAVDAAGRTAQSTWTFGKDTTAPGVVFNNIETDGSTVLLDSDPKIQGSVTDAVGVFAMESRIERYDFSTTVWTEIQGWTSLGAPAGAAVASWSKNLGPSGLGLADGLLRISVRARDGAAPDANVETTAAVEFRIDRANPVFALNASGLFQNADFTITGSASDANTVTAVRAKVGDGDFSTGVVTAATTANAYAAWSVTVPAGGLPNGSHTVYIEAEDGAGRKSLLTREFTFDGVDPTVIVTEPPSASRVNGLVTVRGTSSDDNAVQQVQYRIGNNATTWQTAGLSGGLYSWSYTFSNVNTYANTADVTEINPATGLPQAGTNVWALPYQVRIVDVAGNAVEELSYKLYVDPDMDAPEVTVISPANDQIVGGEVRVSGYATDDDWVRSVEMRVDPTGTGTSYGAWEAATLVNQGTQVNWFKNINSSGELNPPAGSIRDVRIQIRAYDSKDFGVTQGIAGDIAELNVKFDSGVPVIEDVRIFRSGVEVPYAAGVRAAGTFSVRATIRDEGGIASIKWRREGQTVFSNILNDPSFTTPPAEISAGSFQTDGRKYLITSVGNTNFTAIGASSNTVGISFVATGAGSGSGKAYEATGPAGDPTNQHFIYAVDIDIDSTTVNSGQYADTSGFFSVDLQATDNATPTPYLTQTNLNIQIDNYYPSGEYTSAAGASTANYYLQGRAWDSGAGSGSIQGIDRVVVYFYRDGGYIAPDGGVFTGTTLNLKDMTAGGAKQDVPFPADAASGIVIDGNEVTVDLDGSGYIEGFTDDGIYKNWYAVFDTTGLADGPVDVNYVVIDRAGNATRYVQPVYIRNNAPRITGVVLGTDVNDDTLVGDILSGESRRISTDYGSTNFTVRNKRLAFTVETTGGNAPNRYSIGYVTGTASTAAADLVQGRVYTIAVPGDTNWTLLGADYNTAGTTFVATGPGTGTGTATGYTVSEKNVSPFESPSLTLDDVDVDDFTTIPDTVLANEAKFVVKVYDTTVPAGAEAEQLAAAVVMGLTIDNIDNQPPTVNAAPFGRKYTSPASYSDAAKILQDAAYTDNLVTTGSGASLVKYGYVQYATPSGDDDADTSGRVIFLGKAADNQRIARLTARIPGYNGGNGLGGEFDIALWDGTALAAASAGHLIADVAAGTTDWGFEAEASSQMITEAYGHVLNWRFAWNTAAVSTVAASDVSVTFKAYDAGPSGGNTDDDGIAVDIVPYITKISNPVNQGGLSDTVIRSSTGNYSIESNGTNYFRVTGFNLSGAVAHVSAAPISVQPGTTNLDVVATSATTVDISKDFLTSGYLTVFVNSIPSKNNLNAPAEAYHSEAVLSEPRSTLWTDDRYLTLWELTQTLTGTLNQTFYYPSMVMNGNQPLFSYANDNDGYTYRTTGISTTAQKGGLWFERHTAMAKNSDGSYWILSAEDAFSGGSMGYLYLNRDRNLTAVYGTTPAAPGTNTNFFEIFGLDYTSRQMNRVRHPKLITEGPNTATNIYITYYDSHPSHRELSFVAFRATSESASNLTQPANDASRAAQVQVIPETTGASSEYYDMVKLGTGEIAVAYFDETAGSLKLKYSANAYDANNLSGGGTWSEALIVDDSALTGSHVSMATGQRAGTTYLYLAYHDAAETALKFAQINWTTKAVTKVVVDNRFSVGTRTKVHVIDDLPYVSFYSDSYSGTRNSMRLAYPVAANGRTAEENITQPGAVSTEEYTGNWEIAAVPTVSVPKGGIEQFNRTMLDVYDNGGTNKPVVAWLADRIEYAKLQPPAP